MVSPVRRSRDRRSAPDAAARPPRPDTVDAATRAPTVRLGRRDRSPAALTLLIAGFVVVALAKPWAEDTGAIQPVLPAQPVATATPIVTPDPHLALRVHCQEPLGWRVYSHEAWTGQSVRTWRSLEPASRASGPLDPALPVVRLGPNVLALGYCSPWDGAERAPETASVDAWRLDTNARGAVASTRALLERIAPLPATPLGGVFGALGDRQDPASPGALGWPAGRYVFAVRAGVWERWWEVEIAPPDRLGDPPPSAAPRPASEP